MNIGLFEWVAYVRPNLAVQIFKDFSDEACDSLLSQAIKWFAHRWKIGSLETKLYLLFLLYPITYFSLSFSGLLSSGNPGAGRRGMNREGVPGKSPEEMYIQQKVRVLLMLRKMGSNVRCTVIACVLWLSRQFCCNWDRPTEVGRWWSGFIAELF